MKPTDSSDNVKDEKKGAKLLARYPILAAAPAAARPLLLRKAMRHPAVLVLLLLLAFVILPQGLGFFIRELGMDTEEYGRTFLFKFWALLIVPSICVYYLFNKFVLPWSLKQVMAKEGYFSGSTVQPSDNHREKTGSTGKKQSVAPSAPHLQGKEEANLKNIE